MKNYSAALKIGASALFLSAVILPEASHGDLRGRFERGREKLRTQTAVLKDLVAEQTEVAQGVISEKKTKIKKKAKEKKDKIVTVFQEKVEKTPEKVQAGAQKVLDTTQKVVTAVRGKESAHVAELQQKLDTVEQTLVKLDNVVSLEVILKMIDLFRADVNFQFTKKQQGFSNVKSQLDTLLTQVERDMIDLRNSVAQKRERKIAELQQAIAGRTSITRQAQQTLEDDNTVMLGVIDGINAFSDNALGFVRTLVARAAATKKETAQRDLDTLNSQIENTQIKLEQERENLTAVLQDPKFQSKMSDLMAKQGKVIAAIAKLSTLYNDMMKNDFFNYFDPSATSYLDSLKTFSDGSGCRLDRDNYRATSIQRCKETLINTLKENDLNEKTACATLTPSADISDVEACITSFINMPLTTFGDFIVKQ